MLDLDLNYIVVDGPIGVGKTSLVKKLADSFGSQLLLEGADENPFLKRFYKSPRFSAFPTQLFFLFQRASQIKEIKQCDLFAKSRIADFLIEKDRLFAELTLDEEEFKLYEKVYEMTMFELPRPDLVIYLQAPVDILMGRIEKRGINYEQHIDVEYLQNVVDAYSRFFHFYNGSPLLIVNAAEIDLVSNQEDYNSLVEQIRTIRNGRHFFNPVPITT